MAEHLPQFGLKNYFRPIGVALMPVSRARSAHLVLEDVHDGQRRLACSATAHHVTHLRPHITRKPLCSRCRSLLVRWWPEFPITDHVVSKDWKPKERDDG